MWLSLWPCKLRRHRSRCKHQAPQAIAAAPQASQAAADYAVIDPDQGLDIDLLEKWVLFDLVG